MDLDFDRSPEVLIAYPGGSMGNIFIEIYSLVTGEMLTTYNAPHYNNSDDICLYVADHNGDYVILAEGAFRVPDLGLVDLVDLLPNTFDSSAPLTVENIFAESASSEVGHYEYRGTVLEKAQYEEYYQQFFKDCQPIEATQIQLIHWSSIEAETKSELIEAMAKTLILSTQEFLDTKK
ncbi:MAG: hypothetical protein IJW46_05975 [Clostridia bacterium]|nr:hypothetical protein [Clostridia bacterium]